MATSNRLIAPFDSTLHYKDGQYLLAERPFGTNIYKLKNPKEPAEGSPAYYAIKVIPLHGISRRQPHSARKEIALLSRLIHPNVVRLYSAFYDTISDVYELVLEFVDLPLQFLLDHPHFSAHKFPEFLETARPGMVAHLFSPAVYYAMTKSFIYQIISAICHLHTRSPPIAHRDINPSNILIRGSGIVKIIDFGVAWEPKSTPLMIVGQDEDVQKSEEHEDDMCCQVATGPFRAPELMYSPNLYNAYATDLWSLGVTIALFFGPLKLEVDHDDEESTDSDSDADEKEDDQQFSKPTYILPTRLPGAPFTWKRDVIFDASRGEIGLLWSIFQVLGTPNNDSWPGFPGNQEGSAIRFRDAPKQDISKLLPHLPKEADPLSLIEGFLVYDPESRLSAITALSNSWFTADGPLLLPRGYPARDDISGSYTHEINGTKV
ncbi:hypothetical protein FRC17_005637 [Serendipita sp. 399]|nr:hypothetical protein FRC17_005637 [Serendipita sp. 399]